MSRVPLLAANWKMFKGPASAGEFLDAFLPTVPEDGPEIVICPSFASLTAVIEGCAESRVEVAAQNMHFDEEGPFTGEVSPSMLVEIGADGVVLGHSERRALFGETDEDLARKVPRALEAGLTPLLCVGETESERRASDTEAVLSRQVLSDLAEVHDSDLARVVIAYEPIWAIGTGQTATPEQAGEAASVNRELLSSRDPGQAEAVRILYGGSVKPANATELLGLDDVDGALVGGASLEPGDFAAIVAAAS